MFKLNFGGEKVQYCGRDGKHFSVSASASGSGRSTWLTPGSACRTGKDFKITGKTANCTVSAEHVVKLPFPATGYGWRHACGHGEKKWRGNGREYTYGYGWGTWHGGGRGYAYAYGHGTGKGCGRGGNGNGGGGIAFVDYPYSGGGRTEEIGRIDGPTTDSESVARGYTDVVTVGNGETLKAETIASQGVGEAYAGIVNVTSGGVIAGTVADQGGTINICSGGEFCGGVVSSGGVLNIRGGTATGLTATGGTINVLSGGSAVFDSVSGCDTAIVIDYSDGSTDTRISSLAAVSGEVCVSVVGMTAGNTYVLAETDNADISIHIIDGLYGISLAAGETYTNAVSGLTYTRSGAAVTVASFAAGIADVTGEIELIAENLINGDEYARRWTGNTSSGGKTAILVLSGTSVPGAVWLDLDGFDAQAEPVNVFGAEGDCMADGTVNIAAKSGKFLNIAGGATRGGTVGTVNFTLAGAAVTGSAFVGGMGNADTVNTLIASGAVEKDFFAGAMANRPVEPTMVGEVNLTVEGGDFGNNLYGGSLVRTEGHTDGIVHSVCEINVTLSGVDSVNPGFSFYAGGMAAGHDDRGDLRTNVYEVGFIDLTITGGDYGTAAGGRGIFGGIFVGDNQSGGTWGTQAEVTGKEGDDRSAVTIRVTGGTIDNLYGGGWAQKGGTSIVASVNITVDGGTIANVYGGGCHSTSPGSDGVSKSLVTGNVNITIGNHGSVTGNIFARGHLREDAVTGVSTVTITGSADRSCSIYGYDRVNFTAGESHGISYLVLRNNSGTFTGNIGGFDRITFSGDTAATFAAEDISAGADGFIENSAWVFDLTGRSDILSSDALLDWSNGTFAGDTVDVKFADDVQARGGWSIANVSTASGATFNLEIGGLSISDLGYGDRITAAQSEFYAGWGFTLDDGTLKFAKLG